VIRIAWIVLGCGAVGLGAIGIVVPGLPTTVFFVAAAACFSKSSPRLEAWVLDLPTVGPMVRDYRAGRGIPRRAKKVAVLMIVVFVGLAVWTIDATLLRVVVAVAGVVGVVVVVRLPVSDHPAP
jgi:uncharacterized membrane protein YbaN (DUF454 family)